jgi:hypothetical protein
MAILAFLERQTATQVIRVNGASTVETFPLLNPAIALTIPARTHVRAAYLVTRDAIDCQHLALIATNPHLWFRHQRTPMYTVAAMASTPTSVTAIYRIVVNAICLSLRRCLSG